MRTGIAVVAALGLAVLMPGSGEAQAQGRQQAQAQQQARAHQQMAQQVDGMIQRMDRVRDRIHQVDRSLARQMDQIQDRQRLQEHQELRDMCGNLGEMAGQMKGNAERMRQMSQDGLFQNDPEMQQEMERLRQHWDEMGDGLEESARIMERFQKRLGQPESPGS